MIIKLQVQHQRIQGVKQVSRLVVESSRHFVHLDLEFDEEWAGLTTTVIFTNDHCRNKSFALLWAGKPLEVPEEVLVDGTLRISCVGVGKAGVYLTTKYMSDGIRVYRSGETSGYEPSSSIPGLWEQVLATVGSLTALDTEDKSSIVAAVNEIHGKSIERIEQTVYSEESGGINEFTITQTNGEKTVLQMRNGGKGEPGVSGVYVGGGEMPDGYNVQIDPNGLPTEDRGKLVYINKDGVWSPLSLGPGLKVANGMLMLDGGFATANAILGSALVGNAVVGNGG